MKQQKKSQRQEKQQRVGVVAAGLLMLTFAVEAQGAVCRTSHRVEKRRSLESWAEVSEKGNRDETCFHEK